MDKSFYYNYDRIISYNALLNILIGERGVGKTYGASKLVVKDFIKKKRQFIYLRRYKTELSKAPTSIFMGCPGSSVSEESACNVGDLGLIPELGRSPVGGHGNPLQYSCLENPHGQRSLAGYSPWGRKESDTTEAT